METKTILLIVFITLCTILVVGAFFVIRYLIFKNYYYPKKHRFVHYKTVRKVVDDRDFRLINNFLFQIEADKKARIDYFMFGEKYFYIILSRYYDGTINGNLNDQSFVYSPRKGKKAYIDNPYKLLDYILSRISTTCGINKSYMIGICLINEGCIDKSGISKDNAFVCTRKDFKKLINQIESRPIGNLKDDQIQNAVNQLDQMNKKQHEKKSN